MAQLTLFNLSLTLSAISGLHDPTKLKNISYYILENVLHIISSGLHV